MSADDLSRIDEHDWPTVPDLQRCPPSLQPVVARGPPLTVFHEPRRATKIGIESATDGKWIACRRLGPEREVRIRAVGDQVEFNLVDGHSVVEGIENPVNKGVVDV